ncbi:nitroreductase family protein [Actinophytocola sediminis]
MTTTRAVRRRLDLTRPVARRVVVDCVRVAQQAPCGSGVFGQHWVLVTDSALRAEIARYYRLSCAAYPLPRGMGARSVDSAAYLAERFAEVPVLALACVETGRPLPEGSQVSLWAAVLPSVWSYQLAARSRGLGTVLTTRHLMYANEIAELLGIPAGVHQAALVPTAYYRGETFRPANRPPTESVTHFDRW